MARQTATHPVYVVAGQDVLLRTRALGDLRTRLLGQEGGMGEVRFDGKTADLPAVLDEVRTLAFLAPRKVVIVEDADKFITENREALERFLEDPPATGVLVLVVDSWRKATKLDKRITAIGQVITAEPMKGQTLCSWLISEAGKLGKTLANDAAQELIAVVGTESGRLVGELEKLSLYVGQRRQIALTDVQALSGFTAEESAFQLTDLIAEGKTPEALDMLGKILEADRSAEFTLVGALTFSFRRMLKAKNMAESNLPQAQIASACKIYPFIAQRFFQQLRRFTVRRLERLLDELVAVDYANKTGLGQAKLNLEKFIVCAPQIQ